jgi:hypothetical protein
MILKIKACIGAKKKLYDAYLLDKKDTLIYIMLRLLMLQSM